MSLHDIQLSPLALTELYRDVLVNIDGLPGKADISVKAVAPPTEAPTKAKEGKPANAVDTGAAAQAIPLIVSEPVIVSEPALADIAETSTASDAPKQAAAIKFLGGNKKRIAFIVNCKNAVFLPDTHLDWLGKMLEACRLNLGDVAIANIAKNQFTIADIKQELFSTTVVLLGTEPSAIQLPLNFPHFNLQPHDGITFLATPPPEQLNQQTQEARLLKSKLWVSLQKLFKL